MKKIPISGGHCALVDDDTFVQLYIMGRWTAQKRVKGFHAAKYVNNKYVYMHRLILSAPLGVEVDHIDGNGLNNQRSNLRLATKSQNGQGFRRLKGKSRFRGVFWHTAGQRWAAKADLMGKSYWCGFHETEEEAARAYDTKAKELFGEFAQLNFP